jgi:hypothetical protein
MINSDGPIAGTECGNVLGSIGDAAQNMTDSLIALEAERGPLTFYRDGYPQLLLTPGDDKWGWYCHLKDGEV